MFNLFKKKESKDLLVMSPMNGQIIALENVPDPVFSGKMVGEGFAVEPSEGLVFAPVSGEIVQLFPTKHAFGIRTEEGLEVLVHVGIDTVQLKGEGFTAHVGTGDKVSQGQLVLTVDLELLKSAGKSTATPVIVTNMTEVADMKMVEGTLDSLRTSKESILSVNMK